MDFQNYFNDEFDRMGAYRTLLLRILYQGVNDKPDLDSLNATNWHGRFSLLSDTECLIRNLHEAVMLLSLMICDVQQRAACLDEHCYDELGFQAYDRERVLADLNNLAPEITKMADLTSDAHEQMFLYRIDPFYERPEGTYKRAGDDSESGEDK
ncbi:MAG: hypothetical protein PUA61_03205 [Succinatimonas hippei]|nr:hypothetical protein [Succinatimonas hippei]